jgi:hypothetical protein
MFKTHHHSAILAFCLALNVSLAQSAEPTTADSTTHPAMTAQAYEQYRIELQRQIEQSSPPNKNEIPTPLKPAQDSTLNAHGGYGQGYHARTERNAQMSLMRGHRGGGRNR